MNFTLITNLREGTQLVAQGFTTPSGLGEAINNRVLLSSGGTLLGLVIVDGRGRICHVSGNGHIDDPASRKQFQRWYEEEKAEVLPPSGEARRCVRAYCEGKASCVNPSNCGIF
jgi:hypothetical protein